MFKTAYILRPTSHRCDARQGLQPELAQWTQCQRPEKTFTEKPYTPRFSCFEYYQHVHMHVCVCVQASDWSGLNSAKKQPDSLMYPQRHKHARADKRVYNSAIILSLQMSVKWNGSKTSYWMPRPHTHWIHTEERCKGYSQGGQNQA